MTKDQREIQRKLRILRYADEIGSVVKACRYFGVGRSSFYRWRQAYAERGEPGLINAPPIPKWHANRTSPEREEKVLYLRRPSGQGHCVLHSPAQRPKSARAVLQNPIQTTP